MLSARDFDKKQIVFIFFNQGEKISFSNDNFIVKDTQGKIKFQCTCYRLFLVFVVGHCCITDGLIQRARKFGFSICLLSQSFKPYQTLSSVLEGNTLLRKTQYDYDSLDLAKHIIKNKICNQKSAISSLRNKSESQLEAIEKLAHGMMEIDSVENLRELMGIEGSASRIYFPNFFNNTLWSRRAPRTKCDMVNALLDIGYTVLFSFLESLLNCYGFDLYCGVMHRNFYMRKSLVCDIIEPFRVIVDRQVRNAVSLKQCKEEDFIHANNQYILKWEKNAEYLAWIAKPIIEQKDSLHSYVQDYYRAFMKQKPAYDFPVYYEKG